MYSSLHYINKNVFLIWVFYGSNGVNVNGNKLIYSFPEFIDSDPLVGRGYYKLKKRYIIDLQKCFYSIACELSKTQFASSFPQNYSIKFILLLLNSFLFTNIYIYPNTIVSQYQYYQIILINEELQKRGNTLGCCSYMEFHM